MEQVGNDDSVTAWLRVMALEKLKDCIFESQVSDAIKHKNRNNSITGNHYGSCKTIKCCANEINSSSKIYVYTSVY